MKEEIEDFIPKIVYLGFPNSRPDWRPQAEFLDYNEVTYVIDGKASYIIDGKTYEMEPGDLLYLSEGSTKKAAPGCPKNPMQCFSINFKTLSGFNQAKPPVFPVISHIGTRKDLIDMLWELAITWQNQESGYVMKTRAMLMLILYRLSEIILWDAGPQTGDYRITKAVNIIMHDYSEKLTVKSLAREVRLNEVYFGRLFKQQKGMSVNEYITKVRVHNAETMLQSGEYKVQEVAGFCGFSNPAHFYNAFRALKGYSPSKCIPKDGEQPGEQFEEQIMEEETQKRRTPRRGSRAAKADKRRFGVIIPFK